MWRQGSTQTADARTYSAVPVP